MAYARNTTQQRRGKDGFLAEEAVNARCLQYIQDAKDFTISENQRERAKTYQDFFRGGTHMWSEDEWNAYRSKGVTPVSINRCKPVLKALLGMYLQNKQDVKVRPRKGGASTVAQVHTEVLKHTQDVSYAEYCYAQVFLRGGIDTEAYLRLKIDFTDDDSGQMRFYGRSLWDVVVDRNATEYDLNESAKFVIDRQWKDTDEILAEYPDHEEAVMSAIEAIDTANGTIGGMAARLATFYTTDSSGGDSDVKDDETVPDAEIVRKYRYLIQHVFWKEVLPELVVSDRQTGQARRISDPKQIEKIQRKAKKSLRFRLWRVSRKVLHESVYLSGALLEDIREPLGPGVSDYPIVRYSPIWDDGYPIGALDDVVELNREENIHRTQTIRLLGQTANSGWMVGKEPTNPRYKNLLQNFGAVPGVVIPKDKFGDFVEKITPNRLSEGHFMMGRQFETDARRVSQVDEATMGYETGKAESGRALGMKMQSNRLGNEIMFSNLYRSLEIFGVTMLRVHLNNGFYTDQEIMQIMSESNLIDQKLMAQARYELTSQLNGVDLPVPQALPPVDPALMQNPALMPEEKLGILQSVQEGTQAMQQYAQVFPHVNQAWEAVIKHRAIQKLFAELRDDKGLYGVKVTISSAAPTERMAQFLQMDALLSKYGQLIPPDVFLDLTDLPQKEEIKARMLQQQQALMAQAQAQPQAQPQQAAPAAA
jgi:hypothetical protein